MEAGKVSSFGPDRTGFIVSLSLQHPQQLAEVAEPFAGRLWVNARTSNAIVGAAKTIFSIPPIPTHGFLSGFLARQRAPCWDAKAKAELNQPRWSLFGVSVLLQLPATPCQPTNNKRST